MFIMGDKHELQQLQLHLNQFVYLLTSIVICLSASFICLHPLSFVYYQTGYTAMMNNY